MRRPIAILGALVAASTAFGADEADRFVGEWKTTMGLVTLERKGDEVTGRIASSKLALKGRTDGNTLILDYDTNGVHVDAKWELEPSGNAFQGSWRAGNGNGRSWNGWRPDPSAARGEPADFSGLWLTNRGLMELKKVDGPKVWGRFAAGGTSALVGEVQGRHLEGRIHPRASRTGPAWLDLDPEGATLSGASGTDDHIPWYGWKGRKAPEFVRHAPLAAGKIVEGSTEDLLTYAVRAPEGYRPGDPKKWPVVLILHGSNMNGKAYVAALAAAWPEVARDYILLGINGEFPSDLSPDGPAFNYTYINHVGRSTFRGGVGTDRQSPALVREAMEELRRVYRVRHYFVGGHSQGGFLTYSLLMNSPESIAGAFPVSAGLIYQCEPSAFADEALKAAQRAVPLAIVHGKTDPLVSFDGAAYSAGLFLDADWLACRFFTDDNAGHMFARLPVGPAIRWLEALASDDPKVLLDFADRRWKESGRRDAIAAIRRARALKLDDQARDRLQTLTRAIDEQAAPKAGTFLEAIRADKDNSWVDGFLAYRDEFEFADAASGAMAAFNALRALHTPPARKAMGEAGRFFRQGQRDEGYARAREVVAKYYASPSYRLARKWAAEQK